MKTIATTGAIVLTTVLNAAFMNGPCTLPIISGALVVVVSATAAEHAAAAAAERARAGNGSGSGWPVRRAAAGGARACVLPAAAGGARACVLPAAAGGARARACGQPQRVVPGPSAPRLRLARSCGSGERAGERAPALAHGSGGVR
eukprot:2295886-Prymnesium_polylepis.1